MKKNQASLAITKLIEEADAIVAKYEDEKICKSLFHACNKFFDHFEDFLRKEGENNPVDLSAYYNHVNFPFKDKIGSAFASFKLGEDMNYIEAFWTEFELARNRKFIYRKSLKEQKPIDIKNYQIIHSLLTVDLMTHLLANTDKIEPLKRLLILQLNNSFNSIKRIPDEEFKNVEKHHLQFNLAASKATADYRKMTAYDLMQQNELFNYDDLNFDITPGTILAGIAVELYIKALFAANNLVMPEIPAKQAEVTKENIDFTRVKISVIRDYLVQNGYMSEIFANELEYVAFRRNNVMHSLSFSFVFGFVHSLTVVKVCNDKWNSEII